ncbi:hypothetical protein DPMN_103424 [Dreissena polymorpha]|uniref:Uncharacterized protein n=1 Tax=Dreissena polymorpha TaxID=45954 RepID=A0A9D4H810_DREPO|nr:hypothetical protein DPMN_103424 [Dreissena polymorpha]
MQVNDDQHEENHNEDHGPATGKTSCSVVNSTPAIDRQVPMPKSLIMHLVDSADHLRSDPKICMYYLTVAAWMKSGRKIYISDQSEQPSNNQTINSYRSTKTLTIPTMGNHNLNLSITGGTWNFQFLTSKVAVVAD